jgi:carboxyl-terminal processing protease
MRGSFSRTSVLNSLLLTLALGLGAGVFFDRFVINSFVPPDNIPEDAAPYFRLIAEARNTIVGSYVDRQSLTDRRLVYGAINGMVDALGDKGHSSFLPPEVVKQVGHVVHDQFVGIGVELQVDDGQVTVLMPMDDSPAQEAGILPGDVLVRADGHDLSGLSTDQVIRLIQGRAGTRIRLEVRQKETGASREVMLERRKVPIRNVTSHVLPGTGVAHVRISRFGKGTTRDLKAILGGLSSRESRVNGLILDLRNNPGGLLDEAIGVASQFVRGGSVVQVKDSDHQVDQIQAVPGGLAPAVPMVILVNGGTASAAEVVAGGLQDLSRATLVGDKTVGTGTVLRQFLLSDGSAILLATNKWLTPLGRTIWHTGITPDVKSSLPPGVRLLLPQSERGMSADQVRASSDAQLLTALRLLQPKKVN